MFTISVGDEPLHAAPATLIGQQVEACYGAIEGMLSDRLDNPKFAPPADPRTGVAHGWLPTTTNMPGIRYELTAGAFLSGSESQMCHLYWPVEGQMGLQQNLRQIRAGEVLELELWAKAMSAPVNIRVGLKPVSATAPAYAAADVCVDAAYWKPYRVVLEVPQDDDAAVFFIWLRGDGRVWFDQAHLRPVGEGHVASAFLRHSETLRIPVMRFPGGTVTNGYHWRLGTGPAHLRPTMPDPQFKATINYDFGTDEYLAMCHTQGIVPHLTLNMGTGTPEEAGEWAAYCTQWFEARGVRPPLAYFEIGNEQSDHHELGHMTPEMYVAAVREFVPAVRRAYPAARVLVKADEHYVFLRPDQQRPWRERILDEVADLADLFVVHCYRGKRGATDEECQENVVEGVRGVRTYLETLIADLRAAGLKQKVALTEWNCWLHAGHSDGRGFDEPYDVQHGLFVAGVLHVLASLGADVELAEFYNLINPMGVFQHRGAEFAETCLADIFRLYRPAFPGQVLPVTNASPALAGNDPAVDALAMRTGKLSWLFLANRSASRNASIRITPPPCTKLAETVMLAGESSTGQFCQKTPVFSEDELRLPPLSLSRLRFE
ncbi:MAG: hypothetical protein PHR35_13380 [Kiritimatiellae bacterium]|nr:hypothetical protein [Kiritimatiellia bacterium]